MIEDFIARKLTKAQKRNTKPTIKEAIDVFQDQSMAPVPVRPPAELAAAQQNLAALALEVDEPEAWLRDVLEALDLLRKIPRKRRGVALACEPYSGTMRGANTHLRTYTRLCARCARVKKEYEADQLRRRGVPEGTEVWTS